MASTTKWSAALSANDAEILTDTNIGTLADDALSSESSAYSNDTNLWMYAWFELIIDLAVGGTWDNRPTMVLYARRKADGTNQESAPATGGDLQGHMRICEFQVTKVGTLQRVLLRDPVLLPPCEMTFYLDNQTGQSVDTNTSNAVRIYPASVNLNA